MTKQEHVAVAQKREEESSLAIVSLVLGVISLTGPGLLLGIPAIVTGIIALKKQLTGRGMAIAGLVTGIVSTVVSVLFCLFLVFLIAWGASHPEEFENLPHFNDSQQQEYPFEQSQT